MLENSKWIKSPKNKEEACYEFYTDFNSEKEVVSAILDITAMGMYCAFINSQRVGDEFFTPEHCSLGPTNETPVFMRVCGVAVQIYLQ